MTRIFEVLLTIYSFFYLQPLRMRRFLIVRCFVRRVRRKSNTIRRLYEELFNAFGKEKAEQIFRVNDPTGIMERVGKGLAINRKDLNNYFQICRPECFVHPPHIGPPWIMDSYGEAWNLKKFLWSGIFSFEKLDSEERPHDHLKTMMLIRLIRWHGWTGSKDSHRNSSGYWQHYFYAKKDGFGLVIPPVLTPNMLEEESKWFESKVSPTG